MNLVKRLEIVDRLLGSKNYLELLELLCRSGDRISSTMSIADESEVVMMTILSHVRTYLYSLTEEGAQSKSGEISDRYKEYFKIWYELNAFGIEEEDIHPPVS